LVGVISQLDRDVFFAQLKAERKARQLTLEDVSRELKIQVTYIQALEDGDYDKLPELVYAVGFMGSYAKFLGLDSKKIVDQFRYIIMAGANDGSIDHHLQRSETADLRYENMIRCGKNYPLCRIGNLVLSCFHDKSSNFCCSIFVLLFVMAIVAVVLVIMELE
jgi:hypothetical protein